MTELTDDLLESADVHRRVEVDRSTRLPVLVFLSSAVFWLVLGAQLALVASLKLHLPEFLGGTYVLSFGAVRPAHLATTVYGWLSMAGIGVMIWLWARLLNAPVRGLSLLLTGAALWNLGVFSGTLAILGGFSRGIEWLEMPAWAFAMLLVGMVLVAASLLRTLRFRSSRPLFISAWYLIAALVWAPIVFAVAILPTPDGIAGAAVNYWFVRALLALWITPVGLAAAYYIIPKVTGRPVYSYQLSYLGFWTFALFFGWTGMHHLVGSAIPNWLQVVSVTFSAMMLIPVAIVSYNLHRTMAGHFGRLRDSQALRFVVFGAVSFTLVCLMGILQAFPFWQEVTHFTLYTSAHAHLGVVAFASMVLYGASYYLLPRLTGAELQGSRLAAVHFWSIAAGISIQFLALAVGGVIQGFRMLQPGVPFEEVVSGTLPWLVAQSASGLLMDVGFIAFAILVFRNLRSRTLPVAPRFEKEEVIAQ